MIVFRRAVYWMSKKTRPPPTPKLKERTKSKALSDEKAGKIAKSDEEAQIKMEQERIQKLKDLQELRKTLPHIKTFDAYYEEYIPREQVLHVRQVQHQKMTGQIYVDTKRQSLEQQNQIEFDERQIIKPVEGLNRFKRKVPIKPTNVADVVNSKFTLQPNQYGEFDKPKRVGTLAVKIGMTALWDQWGKRHALTVLQLDRVQVTQVKSKEYDGVDSIQVGIGEANLKRLKKPEMGHFLKYNIPPKKHLTEFKITPENALPIGYMITARHFTPGQFVDVQSRSCGKGFAGTVKRHGFKMQPASHGNSISHRKLGSTGQRQDPGRVFKNKKMPGRMGGKLVISKMLKVYKVDYERQLVYVKGSVPGKAGILVKMSDSQYYRDWDNLNFPTWIKEEGKEYSKEVVMIPPDEDPEVRDEHENALPKKGDND